MIDAAHAMAASRGFLWEGEVDAIQAIVRSLPEHHCNVVDIGAGAGTTALAVLEARNVNITVWTIDVNHENLDWARLALSNVGLVDNWVAVYSASARRFLDRVDFLLVDGDHSFEGVSTDLTAWLPAMVWKAPVWVDDYDSGYPGVPAAVQMAPLIVEHQVAKSVVCHRA